MKILIIKTSSMGDIIHTLPALTDAGKVYPDIRFDWVVEEAFAEIPSWHPLVDKVIPVAWRRWRKNLLPLFGNKEWKKFRKELAATQYDLIIDAQGLLKSAIIARLAKGPRSGLNFRSAWEPLASLFYQRRYPVNPKQHAIDRVRQLFAQALNYALPNSEPIYNINTHTFNIASSESPYIIFIHGTTWPIKEWPQLHWLKLAMDLIERNYAVKIPWGNDQEKERAEAIAAVDPLHIEVLPKATLNELAGVINGAKAVIAVDTGLGHLAAALAVPAISLYGPTHPDAIGTRGIKQTHLYADFNCNRCDKNTCRYQTKPSATAACLTAISADAVLHKLQELFIV